MTIATIKTIGILGAGQMGGGIAQVAAQTGRDRIGKGLSKLVEKGKLPADERDAILERIVPVGSLAELAGADFAIEAATEGIELKKQLMRALDEACRPEIPIATNTSSI